MQLRTLRLRSFRAHEATSIALSPGINLFVGPNGAGKTNVLEAVHYLCLAKSFVTASDTHAVRRGQALFEVEGTFEGERRPTLKARLVVVPGEGKRVFLNGAPLDRLADLVGQLPVVALSPADHELTAGGPEERRRFLDSTLSQAYPLYLDDLLKYRRALKQRNALLMHARRGRGAEADALRAWDEELVLLGTRLIVRRRRFLAEFAAFLAEAYQALDAVGDEPTMEYVSVGPDLPDDEGGVADLFRSRLQRVARRERELGRTLVGPHLDEVVLRLGGFEVRPFASQGQHRTFGLALRLATYFYLNERLGERPILLLDDVFGALDAQRARVVLALLESDRVGQSLISAARPEPFQAISFDAQMHTAFTVQGGEVSVTDTHPSPS